MHHYEIGFRQFSSSHLRRQLACRFDEARGANAVRPTSGDVIRALRGSRCEQYRCVYVVCRGEEVHPGRYARPQGLDHMWRRTGVG